MVVMRQVVESGSSQNYTISVTRLDWDTKVGNDRFKFQAPAHAREESRDTASAFLESTGGYSSGSGSDAPGGLAVRVPPGMLSVPESAGFAARRSSEERDAGNRVVVHSVDYEAVGGRTFQIEQRIRSGGLPVSVAAAGKPATIAGKSGFVTMDGEILAITWAEGDLIVRISSADLGEAELRAIAESLEPVP
jgi:hypothetical protein